MKTMKAYKAIAITLCLFTGISFSAGKATALPLPGIPVFDGGNFTQNIVSAVESVSQTLTMIDQYLTQVDQYSTQLDQFDNMIRNTAAPGMYIWDKTNSIINKVLDTQRQLDYYSNYGGDLESYMSQYRSSGFYRSSPCYGPKIRGCSETDRLQIAKSQEMAQDAQKQAADQLFRSIDAQQKSLKEDAAQLERLQTQATKADGQMKALQAANQLASAQAQQLMQIRAALASEQIVLANKIAAENDAAARDTAMKQQMTGGSYKPLAPKVW